MSISPARLDVCPLRCQLLGTYLWEHRGRSGFDRAILFSFGLWKVTKSTCADTVVAAIKAGYRLFDCACDYGNEKEAGDGLKRAIAEGLVKREEVCK